MVGERERVGDEPIARHPEERIGMRDRVPEQVAERHSLREHVGAGRGREAAEVDHDRAEHGGYVVAAHEHHATRIAITIPLPLEHPERERFSDVRLEPRRQRFGRAQQVRGHPRHRRAGDRECRRKRTAGSGIETGERREDRCVAFDHARSF